MPSFEPADHGVIVTLSNHVLIIPNLVTLEFIKWLLILNQWVSEIAKFECIIIVSTILLDADEICIRKHEDLRLVRLNGLKLKWDINCFVVDQIPNQNIVFPGFQYHHFFFA
jgi:hypothetical protein